MDSTAPRWPNNSTRRSQSRVSVSRPTWMRFWNWPGEKRTPQRKFGLATAPCPTLKFTIHASLTFWFRLVFKSESGDFRKSIRPHSIIKLHLQMFNIIENQFHHSNSIKTAKTSNFKIDDDCRFEMSYNLSYICHPYLFIKLIKIKRKSRNSKFFIFRVFSRNIPLKFLRIL